MATRTKKPEPELTSSALIKHATRKKPKVDEKWVMPVSLDTREKVQTFCRLQVIADDMKPIITQNSEAAKAALFDTWTNAFFQSKSLPENPHLHVPYPEGSKHPGMTDMKCLFMVKFMKSGISSIIPAPEVLEELGKTPTQFIFDLLVADAVGLSQENARRFVAEEVIIEDRVGWSMSLTEMEHSENPLLVSYAKKFLAFSFGKKVDPFVAEELQAALETQQVAALKEGLPQRILGYCRDVEELRNLIVFCKMQQILQNVQYGLADSASERVERMKTTIEEFLLDVEVQKDSD
jgi:hypothetical protein